MELLSNVFSGFYSISTFQSTFVCLNKPINSNSTKSFVPDLKVSNMTKRVIMSKKKKSPPSRKKKRRAIEMIGNKHFTN